MQAISAKSEWLPLSQAPVGWLRLDPDGGCWVETRHYPAGTAITDRVEGAQVRKAEGVGQPLRLISQQGEAVIRYRDGAWERYPMPPELDPYPYDLDEVPAPPAASAAEPAPTPTPPAIVTQPRPVAVAPPPVAPPPPVPPVRSRVAPSQVRPWLVWRVAPSVVLTAILVAVTTAASRAAASAPEGRVAAMAVATENLAAGWDFRCLAHAVVNPTHPQLVVWLVGLAIFGLFVERNAGFWRAVAVVLSGAAGGVLGYELFNTPAGQLAYIDLVDRVAWEIVKVRGFNEAQSFAQAAGWLYDTAQWNGPVSGSAGVAGALIAYAVLRRRLSGDAVTVRPLKLVAALIFFATVAVAWPKCVSGPFPLAMFLGGVAGGIAVIFPEKVLKWLWDKLVEAWRESNTA